MTAITDSNKCTGCQACRLVCPVQCISMVEDHEGFQVPNIDEPKCTNCALCISHCPEETRPAIARDGCIKVLGARVRDDSLLFNSASGGVFAGVAAHVLRDPGNAVFGCAFDESLTAKHVCVTDINDIFPLQSSKYVQSDVGNTYSHAKDLLESGKTVFYSGCPCQIAGLYSFLGKDYESLLTTDIICHGVPSPLLFKRYIIWLEEKLGGKIIGYNFREKSKYGWSTTAMVATNTVTKYIPAGTDPYYNGFIGGLTLRNACYSCRYASIFSRLADFTVGDFWGIEIEHPEFFDNRGVSAFLVNTAKGELFFKKVQEGFELIESSIEKVTRINKNLYKPSSRPILRDEAYKDIQDVSADIFNGIAYKISIKNHIKIYARHIAPSFALNAIKKVRGIILKQHNKQALA